MKYPIPKGVLAQHIVVLGKTRSGKSSTMRLIVEGILDDQKPVCIIDPKGDWYGIKSSASGKQAGYNVVIFGGKHADVPINQHSGKVVGELVATGNRPCIIDLGGWMVGERTRFFIDFASTLFTKTHGHRWLVIDECHNFCPQGKIMDPDAGKMLHWSNRLASEGAGKGIVLLSASQRPQKVHKDYLTSHETLIAKRVIHPLDRGAMKDWIDGCGDPVKGKEVLDTLASLQRDEGWVWSPEIDFGPKRVHFPMFSTYDSFAVQTGGADKKLRGWAEVDLDEVKAKLAAVAEEVKANDPKELRAQLAEKNKEINRLQAAVESGQKVVTADPRAAKAAIAEAEERGFEQARKKLTASIEKAARTKMIEELGILRETFAPMAGALDAAIKAAKHAEIDASKVQFTPAQPAKAFPPERATLPQKVPSQVKRLTPSSNGADRGPIDRPLQLIINAVRWWNVMGIDTPRHAQVAFVAGYSHKSGTWGTYLSRLRSLGLIEGRGDLVLTPEGADVVQDPDTPPTDEQLRAAVLEKLDAPLVKILAPIIAAYPNGLSHQDAGEQAGYSSSSGTWGTYLSRLRSLDLIEGRGELKAQDWLFPLKMAA